MTIILIQEQVYRTKNTHMQYITCICVFLNSVAAHQETLNAIYILHIVDSDIRINSLKKRLNAIYKLH